MTHTYEILPQKTVDGPFLPKPEKLKRVEAVKLKPPSLVDPSPINMATEDETIPLGLVRKQDVTPSKLATRKCSANPTLNKPHHQAEIDFLNHLATGK